MDGSPARGLIDYGSTKTIVGPRFTIKKKFYSCGVSSFIVGFDGSKIRVQGESLARLTLANKTVTVPVVHSSSMLSGVDLIVGLDLLRQYRVTFDGGRGVG